MENHPPGASVTEPVGPAIERVRQILLRPFDFGKWIALGFCAWLAELGQGGFNYSHTNPVRHSSRVSTGFAHARDYVQQNLTWIVPLAIGLIVVILVLAVLVLWLQSRGSFMLLHCVALNRAEVTVPWRKFAREARSLWLFKLAFMSIGLALMLPIIGWAIWMFSDMFLKGPQLDPANIPYLIAIGLAFISLTLLLTIGSCFTHQFVVPIMYLRGGTCMEGWRVLLPLVEANQGRFVLYLLFQFVIGIAIGLLVLAFVLCTCCIGGVLLIIPFIGAVVRLPITIFRRSYSLYYLAQYGAEFDVFGSAIGE